MTSNLISTTDSVILLHKKGITLQHVTKFRPKLTTVENNTVQHIRIVPKGNGEAWIKCGAISEELLLHDKDGEAHFNVVSAFIKSMRGSDPDASVYWLMRMLEAGDDPLFILRRLMIFASEDVGNADPRALQVAVSADQAFRRMGMPEGIYPIAHACLFLASPDGILTRYLYGVKFTPRTLRLGLAEAGQGKIGTTIDKVLLWCFSYDSESGQYTPVAWRMLRIGAVLTIAFLAFLFFGFRRRSKTPPAEATA